MKIVHKTSLRDVLASPIAPDADFGKCARLNLISALCPSNGNEARRQLLAIAAAYALAEIDRIDLRSVKVSDMEAAE